MTYKPVYDAHERLLKKVMADPESHAAYETTKLQLELSMKLKKARIKKNMTQEEVAKVMHTKKPAISRIEALGEDVRHFPSLLTFAKYASAIGYELKIGLFPIKKRKLKEFQ